jgi:hypothetical protein
VAPLPIVSVQRLCRDQASWTATRGAWPVSCIRRSITSSRSVCDPECWGRDRGQCSLQEEAGEMRFRACSFVREARLRLGCLSQVESSLDKIPVFSWPVIPYPHPCLTDGRLFVLCHPALRWRWAPNEVLPRGRHPTDGQAASQRHRTPWLVCFILAGPTLNASRGRVRCSHGGLSHRYQAVWVDRLTLPRRPRVPTVPCHSSVVRAARKTRCQCCV